MISREKYSQGGERKMIKRLKAMSVLTLLGGLFMLLSGCAMEKNDYASAKSPHILKLSDAKASSSPVLTF